MARLQDFQTVTPQDTDKLLIVQAAGQGLATIANIASKIFGLKTAADLKLNSSSGAPTTEEAIARSNPIDQTAGKTKLLYLPIIFGAYYLDQWEAYVYLPFVCKNNNYTVTVNNVWADNIGSITSKVSVVGTNQNSFFTIRTTRTMTSFPNMYSCCRGRIECTITFA